ADPFRVLRAGLVADHALQIAHEHREGMRSHDRADHVVSGAHRRRTRAQGFVDRFLQRAAPRQHRSHLRTEELHPSDVGRLTMGVLLPHVHDAGEAEERAGGRSGDAMLPRPGLGDDPLLPQVARDEHLAERVVDLVGAGMRQVLSLQPDLLAELLGQTSRVRDRRGTTDERRQQGRELAAEGRIDAQPRPCLGQLIEGRDQHLRRVATPVDAEASSRIWDRGDAHQTSFPWISASTAAPGSSARINDSPTRMADAPARMAASTSSRSRIPLSSTATRPAPMRERRPSAAGTSTSSDSRSLAFTPTTSASVASARSRSPSLWVSTNGSIPTPRATPSIQASCSSGRHDAIRSTVSAPAALASRTWSGCTRKSLRSTGCWTAARTARRSSSEPPKWRGSVRTEMTAAPPRSYAIA